MGPDGVGGIVGVASQLASPSGDLHLMYEARNAEQLYNQVRQQMPTSSLKARAVARELYEKHMALKSFSESASAHALARSIILT